MTFKKVVLYSVLTWTVEISPDGKALDEGTWLSSWVAGLLRHPHLSASK